MWVFLLSSSTSPFVKNLVLQIALTDATWLENVWQTLNFYVWISKTDTFIYVSSLPVMISLWLSFKLIEVAARISLPWRDSSRANCSSLMRSSGDMVICHQVSWTWSLSPNAYASKYTFPKAAIGTLFLMASLNGLLPPFVSTENIYNYWF
jgi:hypothetical protein